MKWARNRKEWTDEREERQNGAYRGEDVEGAAEGEESGESK